MSIGQYIKEIGRGKDGARALSRKQAADLFGQVLDGKVTDLEVGAFCLAMRIKGETPSEMAGFLDATRQRMQLLPAASKLPTSWPASCRRRASARSRWLLPLPPGPQR